MNVDVPVTRLAECRNERVGTLMLDVTEVNNAVLAAVAAFGDPIDGPLDFVRIEDLGHGRFNVTFKRP